MAKVQKLRNNEYYDMQTAMDNLYEESKKGCTFTNLMPLIIEEDNILLAYRNIKKEQRWAYFRSRRIYHKRRRKTIKR